VAIGLSTTLIQSLLNTLRNVSYVETAVYVKLHTGDPGAAGSGFPASETTRKAVTFNAPSGNSMALASSVQWTSWPGASDVLTHVSLWDDPTAGNFLWSGALAASKTVNSGDTFTLSTLPVSFTPQAA
jgi:hypothetical protein